MASLIVLAFMFYNLNNFKSDYYITDFLNQKYNIDILNLTDSHQISSEEKMYVAHAGGKIGKYTYVNNYEALKNSYNNGFRLIELDVEFTSDGVPVMLHSWDGFVTEYFNIESNIVYSYDKFMSF